MWPAKQSHRAPAALRSRTYANPDSSSESLPTARDPSRIASAILIRARRYAPPSAPIPPSPWKALAGAPWKWPRRLRSATIPSRLGASSAQPPLLAHLRRWRIGISKNMPSGTSARVRLKKTAGILPFTSYQSGVSAIFVQFDAQMPSSSSKALSAAASTLPAIASMRSFRKFFLLHLIAT